MKIFLLRILYLIIGMILGCGFVFAYYKVKFLFYKEPVPTYIYLGRKESEDVITNNEKTKKDNRNKKLNIVNSPLMAAELANIILSSRYHTILRKPIYVHLRNKSIWDISAVDKDWTIYTYGGWHGNKYKQFKRKNNQNRSL